jgi:hypothetical protein
MIVIALRYIWRIVEVIRSGPPDEAHVASLGEER